MDKTALVLEGGAIRGIYTAGVLDTMLKHELNFPYTVGVSAGAAFGASYISRQIERNLEINTRFTNDPRYMGYRNLVRKGAFFNFDFIFGEIPEHLVPFDFETFFNSGSRFVTGITNCRTAQCDFFESTDFTKEELKTALTASSSMPFVSKMIPFKDQLYLDGGISECIPMAQAYRDGKDKLIVVLTRNFGYRKKPFKSPAVIRRAYRKYPEFAEAIVNRPEVYNAQLAEVEAKEKAGELFVIRPQAPVTVKRMEKDVSKIRDFYFTACQETEALMPALTKFLQKEKAPLERSSKLV